MGRHGTILRVVQKLVGVLQSLHLSNVELLVRIPCAKSPLQKTVVDGCRRCTVNALSVVRIAECKDAGVKVDGDNFPVLTVGVGIFGVHQQIGIVLSAFSVGERQTGRCLYEVIDFLIDKR